MIKRSLLKWSLLACFALATGLLPAALSFPSQNAPRSVRPVTVDLSDTGKTVALSVGQQLVVTLPLLRYDDNYWYVSRNSGKALKLIAGPDERRSPNSAPSRGWSKRLQVFYFRREFPGTVNLVMEQSYPAKPMLLKVVDR